MMSDQGKFINTYIDVMVGTIHELMNSSLQLKTQLKISADLLAEKDKQIGDISAEKERSFDAIAGEKDKVIADLLAEKESLIKSYESRITNSNNEKSDIDSKLQSNKQELDSLRSQLTKIQQEVEPLRSKASHADSLLQQIVVMKQEIRNRDVVIADKDRIISEKNKEIEELKTKDLEVKPKKSKTVSKLFDVLETAQINNVKDTLSKNKDDF